MSALLPAASQALRAGRPGVATILLRAATAAGEDAGLIRLLDARARIDRGDAAGARALLKDLDRPDALRLRAEAALACNDAAAAAADAASCLIADPRGPHAPADKALLGAALLAAGQLDDAATCLSEALAAAPQTPGLWCQLARAQPAPVARRTLADARALLPGHAAVWTESTLQALRDGDAGGARALAEAARDAGVADAQTLGLLGHACTQLGAHAAARDAYAAALTLAPSDPYVRHLACAGHMRAAALARDRAPGAYVRAVFDGYAGRFDAHLIGLGYRVPGLTRAAVLREAVPGEGAPGPVLDLGCGTGLLAVALEDVPLGPWTGVDLSPRMLARAEATGLYAALHEADILAYLDGSDGVWPLILAGDVFCYLGDLGPVITGVARRLAPAGRFVFSVETADDDAAWHLLPSGRYAHGRTALAVLLAAAGLRPLSIADEALRREGTQPVPGLLVVAGHAA